jgi:hypothetical protein
MHNQMARLGAVCGALFSRRRVRLVAAFAALVLPFAFTTAASADTAPLLSCGTIQPGPCSQTAHFTDDNEFFTPQPGASSCPSFVQTDYAHVVGSGQGVEHVTIDKAQDAWLTSTFTGTVTLTIYPPSSLSFDGDGNVSGIIGPPEPNLPVFTGKLTEWFGGSFNNQNATITGTVNLALSGGGLALSVHALEHGNWGPGR